MNTLQLKSAGDILGVSDSQWNMHAHIFRCP